MLHKFPYPEFTPLEIPDNNISGVYELSEYCPRATDKELVLDALADPIGCGRLADEVSAGMKIVIAVDDSSRTTRTDLMLPLVLDELLRAGVSRENVTVFIALGTHRQMSVEEMAEKYTNAVVENYRIINPDWHEKTAYVKVGQSSLNFDIRIHREIMEADYVIGVGQTIPHMIAGFGGGGKIINPGCADGDTIGHMHWLCNQVPEDKLFAVRDNAVRQIIDEVALKAGLRFIINEVPGSNHRIAAVFAGDPVAAHRRACLAAKDICTVQIDAPADIVIADSYGADIDFWQALKGLNAAYGAVKKGGTVILVTLCPEGTSSQHGELTTLGYIPVEDTKRMVETDQLDRAVAANLLLGRRLLDKAEAYLVTLGIDEKDTRAMGFNWAPTPDAALQAAIGKHGRDATINVLYKASKMICSVKEA
ncbi:MAG: nickel-dependent lactate racemase [Sedimentisphaerales bacterium]|nr:nickel-dependent lactate racemase [Sedimentisphaerales bacterium]